MYPDGRTSAAVLQNLQNHLYHSCQKFCLLYSNESQESDIMTTNQIQLGKTLRKSLGVYPDTDKHVSKFLFVVFCLRYI